MQRFGDESNLMGTARPVSAFEDLPVLEEVTRPRRVGWIKVTLIVAGSILGGLMLLTVAGVVLVLCFGNRYGTEIRLTGGSQLFYTDSVTEGEAQKLAQHLEGTVLKGATHAISFQVNRAGDRYQLRIVTKEGFENNDLYVVAWKFLGVGVSQQVFGGAPVDIHLCDTSFNAVRELPAATK
jgi:hypothetical protein